MNMAKPIELQLSRHESRSPGKCRFTEIDAIESTADLFLWDCAGKIPGGLAGLYHRG